MRVLKMVATLGIVSVLIGIPGASSTAQVKVDLNLGACDLAKSYLSQIRDGAEKPQGVLLYPLLHLGTGYKAELEKQLYLFDGYREHSDVRANCKPEQWPAEVKPESIRAALQAGVKANPDRFCGPGTTDVQTPASLVPVWLANPEQRWFEDRVLEMNNRLDPLDGKHETMDRHLFESEWLRDASKELVAACQPNTEVKKALDAAELSLKVAKENVYFRECVKAREAYQPAMQAFDAAAKTQDPAAMKTAYAALENAAKPVKTACKASEEGSKEVDYILASRKMQVSFIEVPGCRDAAKSMNDLRQSMNGMSKPDLPAAIAGLRQAAKDARKACKNDPAPETWGKFVAWVAEKNLTRIP